jgi:hypothetical protein
MRIGILLLHLRQFVDDIDAGHCCLLLRLLPLLEAFDAMTAQEVQGDFRGKRPIPAP